MDCPRCGAKSEVLDTKAEANFVFRRRRLCDNGHRFLTYEVHSATFTPRNRRLVQMADTIKRRVALWKRDQLILAEMHKGWQHIGRKFGLSRSAVFLAAQRGRTERDRLPAERKNAMEKKTSPGA